MTVITAVRKNNFVAIAADSQTNQGRMVIPGQIRISPQKIHKVAGAYIGVCGSTAHHSVLRSLIRNHQELFCFDGTDAVFETFRSLHPILREDYYLETDEDDSDQEYESNQMSGLIASPSGIFSFFSYREITEYETFWAAGSGDEFAIGAMEAVYKSRKSAKAIAEIGVQAACKFDNSCGLPLESYEIEIEV